MCHDAALMDSGELRVGKRREGWEGAHGAEPLRLGIETLAGFLKIIMSTLTESLVQYFPIKKFRK